MVVKLDKWHFFTFVNDFEQVSQLPINVFIIIDILFLHNKHTMLEYACEHPKRIVLLKQLPLKTFAIVKPN
jgi:hypothetical protein